MNSLDRQYTDLLIDILDHGTIKGDRTGTGNISIFGRTIRHKMSDGFPLITTKKVYFKGVAVELLWFLKGGTNIKYMVDNGCNIWVGDAYKQFERNCIPGTGKKMSKAEFIEMIKNDPDFAKVWGELGPVYGKQWRNWEVFNRDIQSESEDGKHISGEFCNAEPIDQIKDIIYKLKNNPEDRRMIVSAWNVPEIPQMTLPPCHYSFQVYARPLDGIERVSLLSAMDKAYMVDNLLTEMGMLEYCDSRNVPKYELSLMFNIRSNDVPLGLPFNLASYGLLLEILAKHVNMVPGELIASIGDAHIYLNQVPMIQEQLIRNSFPLPKLEISDKVVEDIGDYEIDDFTIVDYKSHDSIKIPLSN